MNAFSAVSTPSLTFEVAGDGILDDPAGLLGPLADALSDGLTLTLTARLQDGTESRLTLVFRPAEEEAGTPPALVAAPSLPDLARIGESVTLDPGTWSGAPVPDLAVAWLVDGVAVPDAAGLSFVPRPEDDGKALAARVVASNAAGQDAAETAARTVTRRPPAAIGTLADIRLAEGDAPAVVETAPAFEGEALVFAATGPGVSIDAATGRLTVAADAPVAARIAVTATNSGGTAELAFDLVVEEKPAEEPPVEEPPVEEPPVEEPPVEGPAAPVAEGSLADIVVEQDAAASVSAASAFRGTHLVFALETAPEGAAIDAVSGLVTIPTDRPLAAAQVTVAAANAAGTARQSFRASVRANRTVFDAAPALGAIAFVNQVAAPASWTIQPGGFARLVTDPAGRNHGDWSLARGDGLYRCLARWTFPNTTLDWLRPFSFVGRLQKQGANFFGARVEIVQRPTPSGLLRVIELRDYTGSGTQSNDLAFVDVGWQWNTWTWVEVEIDGATMRARIYPETATTVPAWQATAQTGQLAPGAFGFGAFSRFDQSTTLDIRRIEYRPLARTLPAAPARPTDADWTIDQIKVQA